MVDEHTPEQNACAIEELAKRTEILTEHLDKRLSELSTAFGGLQRTVLWAVVLLSGFALGLGGRMWWIDSQRNEDNIRFMGELSRVRIAAAAEAVRVNENSKLTLQLQELRASVDREHIRYDQRFRDLEREIGKNDQ